MGKLRYIAKNRFNATLLLLAFIFLLLIISDKSFSQSDTSLLPVPEKTIHGSFSQLYVDNLFNYYLVNKNEDGFIKLNANGDSMGVYNQVRKYGIISFMDVSNPLKVLIYYKDYNLIVALDRLLNTTAVFDLRRLGILQSTAIALSYDNNLWVYDSRNTQLKKINEDGKIVFESADFKTLFDTVPQPTSIIDKNGLLYLYDKNIGLMIMDYYGALKTVYNFKGYEDVTVYNDTFYGRKNTVLFYSVLNNMKDQTTNLPGKNILHSYFMPPFYFILYPENIVTYKRYLN